MASELVFWSSLSLRVIFASIKKAELGRIMADAHSAVRLGELHGLTGDMVCALWPSADGLTK